ISFKPLFQLAPGHSGTVYHRSECVSGASGSQSALSERATLRHRLRNRQANGLFPIKATFQTCPVFLPGAIDSALMPLLAELVDQQFAAQYGYVYAAAQTAA